MVVACLAYHFSYGKIPEIKKIAMEHQIAEKLGHFTVRLVLFNNGAKPSVIKKFTSETNSNLIKVFEIKDNTITDTEYIILKPYDVIELNYDISCHATIKRKLEEDERIEIILESEYVHRWLFQRKSRIKFLEDITDSLNKVL